MRRRGKRAGLRSAKPPPNSLRNLGGGFKKNRGKQLKSGDESSNARGREKRRGVSWGDKRTGKERAAK